MKLMHANVAYGTFLLAVFFSLCSLMLMLHVVTSRCFLLAPPSCIDLKWQCVCAKTKSFICCIWLNGVMMWTCIDAFKGDNEYLKRPRSLPFHFTESMFFIDRNHCNTNTNSVTTLHLVKLHFSIENGCSAPRPGQPCFDALRLWRANCNLLSIWLCEGSFSCMFASLLLCIQSI